MGTKRYLACGPWRAKKGQSVILLSGRLAELLHLDDREKKQQQQQLRPRAHRKTQRDEDIKVEMHVMDCKLLILKTLAEKIL